MKTLRNIFNVKLISVVAMGALLFATTETIFAFHFFDFVKKDECPCPIFTLFAQAQTLSDKIDADLIIDECNFNPGVTINIIGFTPGTGCQWDITATRNDSCKASFSCAQGSPYRDFDYDFIGNLIPSKPGEYDACERKIRALALLRFGVRCRDTS